MAYTTTDLANIRAAKLKLAQGDRVGEFQHGGTRIKYSEVTMNDLLRFEQEILAELKPRRRRVYLLTGKGV